MEEIVLTTPSTNAPEEDVRTATPSPDDVVPLTALRDHLQRYIDEQSRAWNRFALTRRGRQRRQNDFRIAMKALAKQTASEIARPVEDRLRRMEARKRIYAAMMVLAEAAAEERGRSLDGARAAARNGIVLGTAAMLALAVLAFSRGWITLTV